jgi:NADH-quinone oxidoreductase subunit G
MLIDYDPRSNVVSRLRPRDNAGVNQFWMCDDGMMSYKRFYEGRITTGLVRDGAGQTEVDVEEALLAAANTLRGVAGDKLAVVLSAQHSNEDNLALVRLARELGAQKLYLAALGGWEGDTILRNADNNPNRAGATLVAGQELKGLRELVQDAQSGAVEGVLALGWASAESESELAPLAKLKVVSLSSNTGALPSIAKVVVPIAVHAETFGTFVNAKGVAQQFKRAVFPAEGIRSGWETLAALSQQIGRDIRLGSLKEVRAALPDSANAALAAANKPAQEAHV